MRVFCGGILSFEGFSFREASRRRGRCDRGPAGAIHRFIAWWEIVVNDFAAAGTIGKASGRHRGSGHVAIEKNGGEVDVWDWRRDF